MKSYIKNSFVVGGMLFLNAAHSGYSPGAVSSMPSQTQTFLNRLNDAGQQAGYLSSLPNSRKGMRGLETYYRKRQENFLTVLNGNLAILEEAQKRIAAEASRAGGPKDKESISDCLKGDKDWRRFKDSLSRLGQLGSFAETSSRGNNFPGRERPTIDSGLSSDFSRVAAFLDYRDDGDGSFWEPIDQCCENIKEVRSQYDVCDETYMRGKLDILSGIQKLPADFVDPLFPGPYAPELSPEDIVALMSLGQMQDFIEAKDFNSQVDALMNTEARCRNAKDEALVQLNKKGELRSVALTGFQALQCALPTLARNWGRTGRQIALGVVKGRFNVFNKELSCPQEVQDSATTMLTYTPEAYRGDFQHLVTLPSNIIQSQPVAKPVDIYDSNGTLMIELRDEAGFTREALYIGSEPNAAYTKMLAAGSQTQVQVVSTGTAGPTSTIRTSGRSVVNGVGATRSQDERVLVRSLASKTGEGDLESARSLAGAVRGRKNQLKENVTKASNDKSLVSARKESRASEARGLVTKATVLEGAVEVSKSFSKNYSSLRRALGLTKDKGLSSDDSEASGRVVERVGSGGNTNTTGSGSRVTSNVANIADREAVAAYKEAALRKSIEKIKGSVRTMAENIVSISATLNRIIKEKQELMQKLPMMADASLFKKLGDADFDDRGNKITSKQQEIVRLRKEINTLNAQEIGMRAAISTAKMSFTSYVNAAAAFQGLDVRRGDIRAPASVNPSLGQQNPYQFNPTPGGSNLPPGMSPPIFNPTPTVNQQVTGILKWMDLFAVPMAYASTLSVEQKRLRLVSEFEAFMKSHDEYTHRMENEVMGVRQQAWERFIVNEREMRAEPLLSTEERVILGAFNDTVLEEVPALIKAKNLKMSAGTDPQIYKYIEQIRSDSAELNELIIQEATLNSEVQPASALQDDESWTGMLPSIALQ